jgi:hypothetical protein
VGLEPLPDSFPDARRALHRIAEQVVAPARKPHNEIALIQVPGGFGTPPFEYEDRSLQVRVEGAEIVLEEEGAERRTAIESIAQAAGFVGADLFPDGVPGDATPLAIDPEAAQRLAHFYAFAAGILEALLANLSPADEPSEVNLWPEHFDIAIEAGPERLGRRATYGASPGDDNHPEPYVYVVPWEAQTMGGIWNATGFTGAELGYADLLVADDAEERALGFFDARREALAD